MQKCFYVVGKYVVQVYILNKTNKVRVKPSSLLHVNNGNCTFGHVWLCEFDVVKHTYNCPDVPSI